MTRTIVWFRRDLRLVDHPALLAAAAGGRDGVLPLFVLDPALRGPAGPTRLAWLAGSLRALDGSLRTAGAPGLHVRAGDPVAVVPALAADLGVDEVHVSADFAPYGSRRDAAVAAALEAAGRALVATGSPYAVSPGRVRKPDGTPYRVYTPFFKAWCAHGWRGPAGTLPDGTAWLASSGSQALPSDSPPEGQVLPAAGEAAALARWQEFRDSGRLAAYGDDRNRPDLLSTSGLSAHLRWGEVHPRTLLAGLAGPDSGPGHDIFRKELAWREFYADVLHHAPRSAREELRPEMARMRRDTGPGADERLAAWEHGRTGYPFVDAGMRQLRSEGWVHNRVRMVVASFLVKDLHLPWQAGARVFMRWLRDGDLASNQHGWQWVAGTGTDAAPYYRVFNPVGQGLRFDPDGDYVRRYVPELAGVAGPAVHEPWDLPHGVPVGYPDRIVDHAVERQEALGRYAEVTG